MEITNAAQRFVPEVSLRDYVSMLLRHKLLFSTVLVLIALAAGIWTFMTPSQYRSTAAVVLRTNNNQQLFPSVGSSQRSQFIRQPGAELEYASSTFFAQQANAGVDPSASVRAEYDDSDNFIRSSLIEFVATAPDSREAQRAANAWAEHYLEARAENDVAEIDAAIVEVEAQIAGLELEKDELLAPIQPIDDALQTETDADVISRLTTQRLSLRQSLEDDLLPITLQLRTLSQDLSNLRIAAGYVRRDGNSATMAIEAPLGKQVAPLVGRNLALGGVLGLMAAAGAVIAVDTFRGVINSAGDLEALAPNTPVLSRLPAFPRGTDAPLALAADAGSTYAQALERVVSTLLYAQVLAPQEQMRVLVTSAVPGEGKTTLASHLAMRLSATPAQTIVIDADLRRPDIHSALGVEQVQPGFSQLLASGLPLAKHLRRVAGMPRVRVISAGAATDDAASLLRRSFDASLRTLPGDYDILLVDAPPVLAVTDAEVMSRSVDGVVLIVRSGQTTRTQVGETLRKLNEAHATLIGFVLVAAQSNAGNGYSNSYQYQTDETTERLTIDHTATSAPVAHDVPAAEGAAPPDVVLGDRVPEGRVPEDAVSEAAVSEARVPEARVPKARVPRVPVSEARVPQEPRTVSPAVARTTSTFSDAATSTEQSLISPSETATQDIGGWGDWFVYDSAHDSSKD